MNLIVFPLQIESSLKKRKLFTKFSIEWEEYARQWLMSIK